MDAPALRRAMLIGLIGEGVGPSLTPAMHELEGARHGMHYVYRTLELEPGTGTPARVAELIDAARTLGYDGLNVTHPIKQTVIPLLDDLSPSARAVGAVNTLVFESDRTIGHNTDVTGFGAAFARELPGSDRGTIVVLGAGGAGAAVATALAQTALDDLVIVDADTVRAQSLAHLLAEQGRPVRSASVEDLPRLLAGATGVVNATPMGMAAHPGAALDASVISPHLFVADIVYRPADTALLRIARERGCRTMSGLGMAMNQAADAFEIFTGEPADRGAMLADLKGLVAAEATGSPTEMHQG